MQIQSDSVVSLDTKIYHSLQHLIQQSSLKRERLKELLMFIRNAKSLICEWWMIKIPALLFHSDQTRPISAPTGPPFSPTSTDFLQPTDWLTTKSPSLYIIFIISSTNVIRTCVINFQCHAILTSVNEMFIFLISGLQSQFQNKSLIFCPRWFPK